MIISQKYKYLFIEIPNTGSTSISQELCEFYGGRKILRKHSNYFEFAKKVRKKEKEYFVFAGIRNPLDATVSTYLKYISNHKSIFTDEKNFLKNGGWIPKRFQKLFEFIQNTNSDFAVFFKKLFPFSLPYNGLINLNKDRCDYIMRFERLEDDFSNVLKLLKINQVRPLPHLNKTKYKKDFENYYEDKIIDYVINVFGPFMLEWGYKFPEKWPNRPINYLDQIKFLIIKKLRYFYGKLTNTGFLKNFKILKDYIGKT